MSKPFLKVDLTEFVAGAKQHVNRDWPKACVNAFAEIAEEGRDDVRALTRREFKLHSDFVTKGIRHLPNTPTQKDAAARALQRFGDMSAAVFLRGASDPRKSLEVMAHHEWGENREPFSPWATLNGRRYIAIPMEDLLRKAARAPRGRIRKRYRPSALIERMSQTGARYSRSKKTTITRGVKYRSRNTRKAGTPFILGSKRGAPMIVRGMMGGFTLEFLYVLVNRFTKIKKTWGFKEKVYASIDQKYANILMSQFRNIPDR